MNQARATRYYAENKINTAWLDVVYVETREGGWQMSYEDFRLFFDLEIPKGGEIAFKVEAKLIKKRDCEVAR